MHDWKVFGHVVSEYELSTGYLDFDTLAKIVGHRVLSNNIIDYVGYENLGYVSTGIQLVDRSDRL